MSSQMPPQIRLLPSETLFHHLPALCDILVETVKGGASVGFIQPFDHHKAAHFWKSRVFAAAERGDVLLFGAFLGDELLGTVQLSLALPPNQPHRADVGKLLVHPLARRAGLGRALMCALEAEARKSDKILLVLDTRSGDPSQLLYESLGYQVAGSIPGYCRHPNSETYEATTYLFKRLE